MKRYFLEFDVKFPEKCQELTGYFDHLSGKYEKTHCGGGWNANSMRTMKAYIRKIRKDYSDACPFNFRVYDYDAPDEPDGHVGQVYFEV